MMVAHENESIQRHGFVYITIGPMKSNYRHIAPRVQMFLDGLPIRFTAAHGFLLNRSVQLLGYLYMQVAKSTRVRSRIHHEEGTYRSLSFFLFV